MTDAYETILLPTDGSGGTGRVLDHAIDLASATGASIHALSVVDADVPAADLEPDRVREERHDQARRATTHVRDRANAADVDVTTAVTEGNPTETILAYAEDHDVDMIVMGTHGRSGVDRVVLGSVAERVVRFSPVPVVTVPLPDDGRAVARDAEAREHARTAIDGEGHDLAAVTDVYRESGTWIVRARTESGSRLNVHVDASTGETRVAELEGD